MHYADLLITPEPIQQAIDEAAEYPSAAWLAIRVDLIDGPGLGDLRSPGRVFAVAQGHTFAEFSRAINLAFGRWDLDCRYIFYSTKNSSLRTGTRNYPDLSSGDPRDVTLGSALEHTHTFEYVYDVAEPWLHYCSVLPETIDPFGRLGVIPGHPAAVDGWGLLPDPWGRMSYDAEPKPSAE